MIDSDGVLARWAREATPAYAKETTRLNLQLPLGIKVALERIAKAEGLATPELARRLLAADVRALERAALGRQARESYAATIGLRRGISDTWQQVDERSLADWPRSKPRGRRRAGKTR
ncbi:MAG: hypothetical protein AABZ30_01305 [Myxococcota bacterium]